MKPVNLQAAILPPQAALAWIVQGYALFRQQTMALIFWSLATSLLITLSAAIPLLGQIAIVTLSPLITFLTLCAGHNIARGVRMQADMWLAPLKSPGVLAAQLRLGLVYMVFIFAAAVLAVAPFVSGLAELVRSSTEADYAALARAIMSGPMLVFGLLYLLISALFWHAPALVGWHQVKLKRALFYSMVACWRNKWAILLYVAVWAGLFYGTYELFGLLGSAGIQAGLLAWISMPLDILLTALLYSTFYPLYASIFQSVDHAEDSRSDQPGAEQ